MERATRKVDEMRSWKRAMTLRPAVVRASLMRACTLAGSAARASGPKNQFMVADTWAAKPGRALVRVLTCVTKGTMRIWRAALINRRKMTNDRRTATALGMRRSRPHVIFSSVRTMG